MNIFTFLCWIRSFFELFGSVSETLVRTIAVVVTRWDGIN